MYGGESTSTEFITYLSKEGIKHELTTTHTPQQNGAGERLDHTLIEGACTMLADFNAYLRNCSPTKVLNDITPYEAWYGSNGIEPNISFLCIFGCMHIVERSKLDLKAWKCVMFGYGAS